jgi:hypothetical protein
MAWEIMTTSVLEKAIDYDEHQQRYIHADHESKMAHNASSSRCVRKPLDGLDELRPVYPPPVLAFAILRIRSAYAPVTPGGRRIILADAG